MDLNEWVSGHCKSIDSHATNCNAIEQSSLIRQLNNMHTSTSTALVRIHWNENTMRKNICGGCWTVGNVLLNEWLMMIVAGKYLKNGSHSPLAILNGLLSPDKRNYGKSNAQRTTFFVLSLFNLIVFDFVGCDEIFFAFYSVRNIFQTHTALTQITDGHCTVHSQSCSEAMYDVRLFLYPRKIAKFICFMLQTQHK